jgi:acylphosphatase
MTKARFYSKDKVQEVGYRVHIMQKILNSGLNGTAINLADGRVEVRLEGEKERIEEFYEELKKENSPELAAGKPEFYELEFNADLMVPDSMRSSQALMLSQLTKGIVYIAGMNENIEGMSTCIDGMNENIEGMSTRIDGMNETIEGMSTRIDGMNENIKGMREEMREGFDKLPERIAKELEKVLK